MYNSQLLSITLLNCQCLPDSTVDSDFCKFSNEDKLASIFSRTTLDTAKDSSLK